jgi:drug/metabolite transporter (DMT)-like permease
VVSIPAGKKASCAVPKLPSERLDVTTWATLLILVIGAMLLILNESGVIAGIDTTTFGYVAIFSALILYLSGGMLGSYIGRARATLRDIIIWLALGLGLVMLYILQGQSRDCGACFGLACPAR